MGEPVASRLMVARVGLALGVLLAAQGCEVQERPRPPEAPSAGQAGQLLEQVQEGLRAANVEAVCAAAGPASSSCRSDMATEGLPKASDVRVRVAATRTEAHYRVLRLCGSLRGKPFSADFPAVEEDREVIAVLPAFWLGRHWRYNPSSPSAAPAQGASEPACE